MDTTQRPHVESVDIAQIPCLEIGAPLPQPDLYRKRFRQPPDGLLPGQLVGVRTPDGKTRPISGNCPESEYLKAVWMRML